MIVVRLVGGLGNQMFQYAAARALAMRNGSELLLDTTWYDGQSARRFALDAFGIEARVASPRELAALPPMRPGLGPALARRLARARLSRGRVRLYLEPHVRPVQKEFLTLRPPAYVEGFFQSEGYFADCTDTIRRELQVAAPASGRNAELLAEISASGSVSVHVRRGDYVSDPVTAAMHNVCDADYYRKAAALAAEAVGGTPRFYVFSDDPDWARAHLGLPRMVVVAHNGEGEEHEDLRLMSGCAAHIIANSSFSWWGAWLGEPAARVVAPTSWLADPSIDTRDVVPARWVRV